MKTLITAAIRCCLMLLIPTATYAISAQWDLDPISGDWNTAANWTPMGVPNGPADIATFDLSHTTDVSISANTEVNGITFTAAASPYGIGITPGVTLTLSGMGITNNSGTTQNFRIDSNSSEAGQMLFTHQASAGNAHIYNFQGDLQFSNRSTAGNSYITNDHGSISFFNSSSLGNSTIDTEPGGAYVAFFDHSTAGSAFIGVTDNSYLYFYGNSTAGNATIAGAGLINFYDSSTAGNATVQSYGGNISFGGSSKGGRARIQLAFDYFRFVPAFLDIDHDVTIGSLEGDEFSFVGLGGDLTVGSNNLSTTFSGVIAGEGGSLTKIGTGTFILSGASTYTGDTNVKGGVLQVDGSINSNTTVHGRGTLAGTGTINADVINNGTVRPGGAVGTPGVLSVVRNYTQTQYATLMIQIAGASRGQFSVLNVLGTAI